MRRFPVRVRADYRKLVEMRISPLRIRLNRKPYKEGRLGILFDLPARLLVQVDRAVRFDNRFAVE